jgi:hypothetical protein
MMGRIFEVISYYNNFINVKIIIIKYKNVFNLNKLLNRSNINSIYF